MKRGLVYLVLLTSIFSASLFGQSDIALIALTDKPAGQVKEAHALAALDRLSAASGWTPSLRPLSIKAIGKISRVNPETGEPVPIDITFKVQGQNHYRIETGAQDAVTIVNSSGAYTIAKGKNNYLPLHAAASIKPIFLPFMLESFDSTSNDVEVKDADTEKLDSGPVHKISMRITREGEDHATRAMRRASPMTVWISDETNLPTQIEFVKVTLNNENAIVHVVRKFSDYRRVNGIMVPFHQEEWIGGGISYTLELSEVIFNAQLQQTDFDVPKATKGGR